MSSASTEITIGIAAASAVAAAGSALVSARGVALSHRPIVVGREYRDWSEILEDTPEIGVVGVELGNEGPGVALNVRWRARSWTRDVGTFWSPPIGSIRSGEVHQGSMPFDRPEELTEVELGLAEPLLGGGEPNYVLWYFETLFTDLRGVRWLVRPEREFTSNDKPRRVRSLTLDLWRARIRED